VLEIDSNIIVRVLAGEANEEGRRARRLLAEADIFVPTTVLLETEWVLRSAYGFTRAEIAAAIRKLAGLSNVELEDDVLVTQALAWSESGMDFADALHLGRARGCTGFVTCDRRLAKAAAQLTDLEVGPPP
jgi:predicted nucleic-acid-binding protein